MSDSDRRAIFDALLDHVFTEPILEHIREFYGTSGDRKFMLVSDGPGIPWPDWYTPSVDNFESTRGVQGSGTKRDQPRLVGIRLDKFNLDERPKTDLLWLRDAQIAITIMNAGGSGGGAITIGGCRVFYDAKRIAGKWTVEFKGLDDP